MVYKQPQIYYLSSQKLDDKEYFEKEIVQNMKNNYYWSDDWSDSFYIQLAKAGFISTTYDTNGGLVLLPELQYDYAVLDFKNLHISKKVQKLISKNEYIFSLNTRFSEVIDKISITHKYNWLKDEYAHLLEKLYVGKYENFKLISVELISKSTNELIAGEIGYMIGQTYTSLSGFSSRERKFNNYGTLQLVLLAHYLEENNFLFWNLGHPHMEYKKRLGCKIFNRVEFLKKWNYTNH